MKRFNNSTLALVALSLTAGFICSAQAQRSYRIGLGFNNQNPADMSTTKQYEFTIDAVSYNPHFNQSNFTINNLPGSAVSSHTSILPYFRTAYRINPKWVIGFDLNHPYWTQIDYGLNSFVNALSVNTTVHSFNLNPRLSYQVNSYLAIGVGFDAFHGFGGELSSQAPSRGPLLTTIEQSQTWGSGFDGGIFVTVRKGTYASLAIFSPITTTSKGQSNYSSLTSVDTAVTDTLPTAVVFRLTQYLKPTWFLRFTGVWDDQSVAQKLVFRNTALGTINIPLRNSDSFLLALLSSYQFNKSWGFLIGGSYEDGSQPVTTNTVGFPIGNVWAAIAGPTLNLNKIASLQLTYAHAWSKSNFNYVSSSAGRVLGVNHTNANVVDFRLSFKA